MKSTVGRTQLDKCFKFENIYEDKRQLTITKKDLANELKITCVVLKIKSKLLT